MRLAKPRGRGALGSTLVLLALWASAALLLSAPARAGKPGAVPEPVMVRPTRRGGEASAAAPTRAAAVAAAGGGGGDARATPAALFERRELPGPQEVLTMSTQKLRDSFLVESLFVPGRVSLTAAPLDRMVLGGAAPLPGAPLSLNAAAARDVVGAAKAAAGGMLARRELAVFNAGAGPARVTLDGGGGAIFDLAPLEALYVAAGTTDVVFESRGTGEARLFLVSAPCGARYASKRVSLAEAVPRQRGDQASSNARTLYSMIVPGKVQTCQLMLGATLLNNGSVWNTMPAHTHARRSEAYLYFNMEPEDRVFHLMGAPSDTRHLVVANHQAVLSPSWSVHAGAGTRAYGFVWVMAGENQDFDDMEPVPAARMQQPER